MVGAVDEDLDNRHTALEGRAHLNVHPVEPVVDAAPPVLGDDAEPPSADEH